MNLTLTPAHSPENHITYARLFAGPDGQNTFRTVQHPWEEFCHAFAAPQDGLTDTGDVLGKSAATWSDCTYPSTRGGAVFLTCLVFDMGTFRLNARPVALRPDALPVPFLAHTHWESEIRLVVPFASPIPRSLLTKPKIVKLEKWVSRSFDAPWAYLRNNSKTLRRLWSYPAWDADSRGKEIGKAEYACVFQPGTIPDVTKLFTLSENGGRKGKSARQ